MHGSGFKEIDTRPDKAIVIRSGIYRRTILKNQTRLIGQLVSLIVFLTLSACKVDLSEAEKNTLALKGLDPIYRAGDTLNINLGAEGKFKKLILQYAADGKNYETIKTFRRTPESISWTVPSTSTAQGRVRVLGYGDNKDFKIAVSSSFRIVSKMDLWSGHLNILGTADGTGNDARLMSPEAMVKVGSSVYIADKNAIRKMDVSDPENPSITTVAGNIDVSGSVDGIGLEARFNSIYGLASDGAGLYITDYNNHTIRRMDLSTLEVTTLAGVAGTTGSSDGIGANALFNGPFGITYLGGDFYVAEYLNDKIRKITPTGTVTTYAGSVSGLLNHGSNPLLARFNALTTITNDGNSLYVFDGSRVIRKINVTSGAVTTLSGSQRLGWINGATASEANYFSVRSMIYDGGYLYAADHGSGVIKKVDATTGVATNLAGFGGDSSGDIDGVGSSAFIGGICGIVLVEPDLAYINSKTTRKVKKVVLSTGAVNSVLGPSPTLTAAYNPQDVAVLMLATGIYVDGNDVYFTEDYSHIIRKLNVTSDNVSHVAGVPGESGTSDGTTTTARFNTPSGIVKFGTDWIVSEAAGNCIRRIDNLGNVTTIVGLCGTGGNVPSAGTTVSGATARLRAPRDMWIEGTDLYVADYTNHKIRKVDLSDLNNIQVSTFAGSSQGVLDGTGLSARFNGPWGITGDGTFLYVSDFTGHTLRKVSLSGGVVTTIAGTSATSGETNGAGATALFKNPASLAKDANYLYIADSGNSLIRKMDLVTLNVTTLAGNTGPTTTFEGDLGIYAKFNGARGIAISGTNLYVANTSARTIVRVNTSTGATSTVAGRTSSNGSINGKGQEDIARFRSVTEVDGFLYATDTDNHIIWRIDSSGTKTLFAGGRKNPGTTDGALLSARFHRPIGITSIGKTLYVVDRSSSTIRKIDLQTISVSTIAGSPLQTGATNGIGTAARFNLPEMITTDGSDLYISDKENQLIRKLQVSNNLVTTIAGTAGVSGSTDGTGLAASFSDPLGLTWHENHLYVADFSNNLIRKIDLTNSNAVTTLAGSAGVMGSSDGTGTAALLSNPSAIQTDGKYLYVTDASNGSIRRINPNNGATTTWIGESELRIDKAGDFSAAKLYRPMNISITPSGVYINSEHRALFKVH